MDNRRSLIAFTFVTSIASCNMGDKPPNNPCPEIVTSGAPTTAAPDNSKDADSHAGPLVIGSGGAPNYGICAVAFMRTALHINRLSSSVQSDESEYRDWFCSTTDNTAAFKFAQALKVVIPDFPLPIQANTAASYDRTSRQGACKDLQTRSFHQYIQTLNEQITDNREAINGFNECVRTIAANASGRGGLVAQPAILDAFAANSPVDVIVNWTPPTNSSALVPWVKSVTVNGTVKCDNSTLPKDIALMPPGNYILSCTRTSCDASSLTIHTYTQADARVDIPKCGTDPCPGVNLQTDPKNCGSCGVNCGPNSTCVRGQCFATSCETHPSPGAVTADTETILTCRMEPGATATLKLAGNHGMNDNAVFPACAAGMCDINAYGIRTTISGPGFSASPHCEGRHTSPCSLQAQGTVTVPPNGLLTAKLRLDGCEWWQYRACDLSWVTISVVKP